MFNLPNLSSKALLLSGASLAAILITAPAQATTLGGMTGRTSAQINATINPATNRPGGPLSPGAAAQKTSQSTQDFSTALARIQGQLSAQASARSVAATGPNNLGMDPNHPGQQLPDVPNGLGTGGLAPSANVSVDPSLWQNADAPTQAAANGQTTVTVHQNAQKAILTWDSFNVGKNTTVHFDQTGGAQSDGTNNWIALNRIVDPSDRPSQILGNITAEGSVYLINNNGIIFGGSSQINVHSLIASSLSFLGENINGLTPGSAAYDNAVAASNTTYLSTGFAAAEATGSGALRNIPNLVLGLGDQETATSPTSYQSPGDVVVQAGAGITTHENGSQGDGGYILLAGMNISNAGTIVAPDGQAVLAAGIGVGFSNTATEVISAQLTGRIVTGSGSTAVDVTPSGTLTNSGTIQATRGYVTLLGNQINQDGAVEVTTGISYPGGISISTVDEALNTDAIADAPLNRRAGFLSFGPNAITADLPEEDGETATSSSTTAFTPGSVTLTAGSIWFQGGSLIEAPGANVSVAALPAAAAPANSTTIQGRIYLDNNATIDVAGLANVVLPASSVLVTIPLIGQNEIADEPNQIGLLGLTDVVVDSSLAGTTADGLAWTGTPILDATGYTQLVPRKIDQLLTNAGSVVLSGGQVITAPGSLIDLDGGYTHYTGGMITTTRLLDQNGLATSIGNANPNDVYVGVAGVNALAHDRWGITDEYTNSLIAGGYYQPDYVQGGNAGTLTVFGHQAVVLDGTLSAQAIPGLKQVAAGQAPSGNSAGGNFLPVGGTFDLGDSSVLSFGNVNTDNVTGQPGGVIVQKAAPQLSYFDANFNVDTAFDAKALNALDASDPDDVLAWTTLPADALSAGGFANVTVKEDTIFGRGLVVAPGTTLAVQPGGSISFTVTNGDASVQGSLVAPSGSISILLGGSTVSATGVAHNITVGPNAVISTAGQWINDADLLRAPGADTFVNGGSISLVVDNANSGTASQLNVKDTTGSVILQPGSILDVSSGGVLLAGGLLLDNDIAEGKGGSVTLETYAGGSFPAIPVSQPVGGNIVMDGTIDSAGFSGGGTLTLQSLGIQIGGDPADAPAWDLYLPEDFFEKQGFSAYQLNAIYDAVIAPGANVRLTQKNLLPNLDTLYTAPSGTNLNAGGLTVLGMLDPYHRQPTDLNIVAGGFLGWTPASGQSRPQYAGVTGAVTLGEGAAIDADAGAAIGLGSPFQVTVLGSIIAPGGSIALSADTLGSYGYQVPDQIKVGSGFTTHSQSVWLGSDAVLDVSGTTAINPDVPQVLIDGQLQTPIMGKIWDGGSVILSDETGYVVAEAGSRIDVSGTSSQFDQSQAVGAGSLLGQGYALQDVWSNAGSIVLAAGSGLYFDGTLKAQAGAPAAQGGTLTIMPEQINVPVTTPVPGGVATTPGATALILQESGDLVPVGLTPGQDFVGTPTGILQFSLDRLNGSGIATLILNGGSPNQNGTFSASGNGPVPVAFAGNVNLSLSNAIVITASQIIALPAGATSIPALSQGDASVGGTTVTLNAPYVAIEGPTFLQNVPPQLVAPQSAGDATLQVNASFIDLQDQFSLSNFGQVNLTSSGDIRLSSNNQSSDGTSLVPGVLYTAGNLTLKAADIYPASDESFILDAAGPNPTTITFLANGNSEVPLSAGGSLLVDADTIVQSGTLRAPFGSIVLGVGDTNDSATQAQFDNLPLTATGSVSLTNGSLTSVSADNTVLPYGTTVDGTNWEYTATLAGATVTSLAAPPAKSILLNGTSVSLNQGGNIDISGGGELQAEEWVPGTGGSRDVLSQYNVDFSNSSTGVTTPLYANARNVYAIVPGYSAPVAAYDPVFAQTTQPAKQANGSASSTTVSLGIGQAGTGDAVGKAVYLSGVPGLPAGVYTLLPAKYATLPGAFRVVQNTSASNVVPGQTTTLADGTHVVSGYFEDALNGSRNSTPSQFEVQSAATWGKYSQYNLTSADTFFAAQAASAGNAAPALPMDAGQLVLAATGSLNLGATLNTAPAKGGAPAEVDIASQDIQIVGSGEAALAGYLQLSASDLDALNAGSLLIGGTRSRTSTGVTILADANSIVVSNDAGNPLSGPEIILVTKTDTTGTDPNAANGLRLDPGSVITTTGTLPASADLPITIGSTTVSGDGSLVRVSNGAQVGISRINVPTTSLASLSVAAGASVNGGAALTLDSSGALNFDPAATFSGTEIAVDAPSITITADTSNTGLTGFVVGPNSLAQFANAKQVDLRSYGDLAFNGNLNLSFGQNIDFSAGSFTSDGGTVTISAPTIVFSNDLNAPGNNTPVPGQGSLIVDATEIDLGSGSKSLKGFGSVAMTATGGIVGQNAGSFDMGSANVTMAAPLYVADTGSDTTLTTTGTLALNSNSGTALTIAPVGGAISFTAGSIADNGATIEAPAGNVSLEAISGDLNIASGSLVSSAGVSKLFYDVTEYAPAGAITLTADQGTVNVASGSTLDFSGANGGGAAGSLSLSAPVQTVALNGTIKGNAADGYLGGSFSLNTGGAVDLDNLATELAASGVNDAITVQTNAGNLTLSAANTITAHQVLLVADGGTGGQGAAEGNITINGTIDASGNAGGEIDLFGKSSIDLEGSLIARGTSSTERGGTVNIGTVGNPNVSGGVVQLDPTYGYEEVSAANSGSITLGANVLIDVSGGTKGGLSGGTVSFRAPLLDAADNHDVNVNIAPSAQIKGSRATTLEAYAVWSTDDPVNNPAQHFDGIVDPAGWYGDSVAGAGQPALMAGTFANASGTAVASWDGTTLTNNDGTTNDLSYYLSNDYFTRGAVNADHQTFYGYVNGDATAAAPGTLMGFVENFPISAAVTARFTNVQNFAVTPGIELDNPDSAINNGNISVLTNWNLGAGTSPTNLAFRFNGQAPVITFKAENDVKVDASLTDGFFQILDPTQPGQTTITQVVQIDPPTGCTTSAATCYHNDHHTLFYNQYYYPGTPYLAYYGGPYTPTKPKFTTIGRYPGTLFAPASIASFGANPDEAELEQYYGLYKIYLDAFTRTFDPETGAATIVTGANSFPLRPGEPAFTATAPTAAQELAKPDAWLAYLAQYKQYATDLNAWLDAPASAGSSGDNGQVYAASGYQVALLAPPPAVLTGPIQSSTTTTTTVTGNPPVMDNTPSPLTNATHAIPLVTASLNSGLSSSYRIVAGANLGSADPDAVQPAASSAGSGSVTLDGHVSFVDKNGQVLYQPTMIRTGTGSIDIAASDDISLLDAVAPGVIYAAGTPAAGTSVGTSESLVNGRAGSLAPDVIATNAVSPDSGGDIKLHAQNDIIGIETTVEPDGVLGQFWWQWMQTGNAYSGSQIVQTSINFGAFDQGVMSVGGNVSVTAGGDISNLQVSLPTTWYLSDNDTVVNTVGGGNLTVAAEANILSGDYFVAKGTGTITAGGLIGFSGLTYGTFLGQPNQVSTLLATQDGTLNVSARQSVDLAGVVDPSYIQGGQVLFGYGLHSDAQGYSPASTLNVVSTTGDVALNTLADLGLIGANTAGGNSKDYASELPSTVELTAFDGGITIARGGELYPSATGELSLIANQSVAIYGPATNNFDSFGGFTTALSMSDAPATSLPSPLSPIPSSTLGLIVVEHSTSPLHADDTQPVRIYSLTGSITDGVVEPAGQQSAGLVDNILTINVDKPAQIYAAADIVDLTFLGQNLRDDDLTRIVAGRDIIDEPLARGPNVVPSLQLGGPGTFDIEAGRNIGPLTNQTDLAILGGSGVTGIDAIGNSENPFLPHESADVEVLFGVGPGIENAAFSAAYVNPSVAAPDVQQALVAFMEQYDEGNVIDTGLVKDKPVAALTLDQAWSQFQALPTVVQQIFNQKALFITLTDVDIAYNDPNSASFHQYARGYQALNTLFPASLGYTANGLEGGVQGADTLVQTGNLDMRSTTIQTQQGGTGWTDPNAPQNNGVNVQKLANGSSLTQGGNITILGPGGQALVGSSSAPPNLTPNQTGILTLETGDVNIFTDQSLLLAQSRVFTEQGGGMTIWSSNGDVNAGKGAKTIADVPAPIYVCDADLYCTRDARGEVSGAGIATLQTIPGASSSNVYLIAPRGTVDAGAAGIRVSGDLFVAALAVANANNIQVQGKSVGLPPQPVTNLTLATASTAATEAAQLTNAIKAQQPQTQVNVEVTGFGGDFSQPEECLPTSKHGCGPN